MAGTYDWYPAMNWDQRYNCKVDTTEKYSSNEMKLKRNKLWERRRKFVPYDASLQSNTK